MLIQSVHSASEQATQTTPPVLHVVDQGIQDAAREFRFTIEEVREYYDKCGDMERTRNRFKKMREVLLALPDEEDPPTRATAT